MRIVLVLLSVLAFVGAGYAATILAAQAIAGGFLAASAVLFVGAAIVEAINLRANEILSRLPPKP